MRITYVWEEGKAYFMSFGFSAEEISRMIRGETIERGNNVYWIEGGR